VAAERVSLLRADSLFAVQTAARGAEGWADFFDVSGIQFPSSGRIEGREAIRAYMAPAFGPDQPRLEWHPTEAHVGAGAELGYTLGRWQSVRATPAGIDTVLGEGNYVTIWRKTAEGEWRVAVDIGNTDGRVVP